MGVTEILNVVWSLCDSNQCFGRSFVGTVFGKSATKKATKTIR